MDLHDSESIWLHLAPGCLAGRAAIVTGGGSGIGRATTRLLAYLGVRVAVVGRTPDGLARTAAGVADDGGPPVLCLPCDVREPDQVDAMLDRALADLGGVDYLVNNAGGQFIAAAETVSMKGFRAVTRLNFDAVWYLTTRVASRAMIPAGAGKIVSVTMTPRRGMPGMAHSSAARAAVESLTSTLAQEWAPHGIRLAAVAPGIVHTDGWEANYRLDPAVVGGVIPARRLQRPEEVAAHDRLPPLASGRLHHRNHDRRRRRLRTPRPGQRAAGGAGRSGAGRVRCPPDGVGSSSAAPRPGTAPAQSSSRPTRRGRRQLLGGNCRRGDGARAPTPRRPLPAPPPPRGRTARWGPAPARRPWRSPR